jgi:hypothetical protein
LHRILEAHKSSPLEFRRRDALVMADDRFNLTVLKKDTLLNHLDALRAAGRGTSDLALRRAD